MQRNRLTTMEDVREYAFAGNATMTLVSVRTGARFTYRVRRPGPDTPWFVSLLRGQDNENDYQFMGTIFKHTANDYVYRHSFKSKIGASAPSARAFEWFFNRVRDGRMPESLEVWHEGHCGRCGRKLTVPESLARGIGPECAGVMRQHRFELEGGWSEARSR